MKQLVLAVIGLILLGCSKEAEETTEVPTPAKRAIAEVKPDLSRRLEISKTAEKHTAEIKVIEAPRSQEGEIEDTETRLAKERERAIELETANNERMAKKLGLSAEEFKNLTIEKQKELIRKHRGRK